MNNTVINKSSNVEDTDNKEIEAIRDSIKKRPDGSPRQTIENVIEILNKNPMLKDAIRRNEFSCKTGIVTEMDWIRRSKTFTYTDFNNIMLRMEKFYGIIFEMTDEEFVCVQMIYERVLHHKNCKPKQYESREITSIMRLKFAEQWEEVKSHRFIK